MMITKSVRSMPACLRGRLRAPGVGRRGSALVEASYVLPLLLLCVLSIMLLVIYFYAALHAQIQTQKNVIDSAGSSRSIFRILKEENETQSQMRGAVTKALHRHYVTKHYVFNMTEAIRLGRNLEE